MAADFREKSAPAHPDDSENAAIKEDLEHDPIQLVRIVL
jgi:hypothetical protein